MNKITTVEHDLKQAQASLEALQAELPNYHALLTDNEADAQRLKAERASLDAQAQAKGRVNVARELLEQHQSDIQSARAEVVRLEALLSREQTLAQMTLHARAATKRRKDLEAAVHEGSEALHRALEAMAAAFTGIRAEREAFAQLGAELVPGFISSVPFGNDVASHELEARCLTVLTELEARGATLTDAVNVNTGRLTGVDKETRPLPTPEHSALLWRVFGEVVAKAPPNRGIYYGVPLPVKREIVFVQQTPPSPVGYEI